MLTIDIPQLGAGLDDGEQTQPIAAHIGERIGNDLGAAEPRKFVQNEQHGRSEEHTSELQSLMRISYAVFCLKKKTKINTRTNNHKIKPITTHRQSTIQYNYK